MFTSPEFYVILAVVAATIVVFAARPDTRGPASEHLLAGVLVDVGGDDEPSVHIVCLDNGNVALTRRGLPDMTVDDAVSLAVKVIGTDVTIEERLTLSRRRTGAPVTEALFTFDFLPQGRYHIRYNSEKTGLFAAFPLHVRPDLQTTHPLKS